MKNMARPTIKWDADCARIVEQRAAIGSAQTDIASEIGVSVETLKKLYRKELDSGKTRADNVLRQTMYSLAVGVRNPDNPNEYITPPDRTMLIFLGKTRLGMKETQALEMSNPDGSMAQLNPTHIILTGPDGWEDEPDSEDSDSAKTD